MNSRVKDTLRIIGNIVLAASVCLVPLVALAFVGNSSLWTVIVLIGILA